MTVFVDTNVWMYALGRDHPSRAPARAFLDGALAAEGPTLVTSCEVVQELFHVYRATGRADRVGPAVELLFAHVPRPWDVTASDVRHAIALSGDFTALSARDLLHLAACRRRRVDDLFTFDVALRSAFAALD